MEVVLILILVGGALLAFGLYRVSGHRGDMTMGGQSQQETLKRMGGNTMGGGSGGGI